MALSTRTALGQFVHRLTTVLLALLCLTSFSPVQAASEDYQLFTSSVAYCSAPIAILVTDLDLHFFPGNSTLSFDLSAESVQDDLNVSIALNIDAYGLGLFNVEIDLCTIAGGLLCPLPKYQFSGGGVFPIPSSFASDIPTIAYTIPDLEAVATIQLTDNSDYTVVGCVQATLSNGHTAKQSGVLWATVGLALFALFSSLLHSVIAQSIGAAQWRLIDVMLAIQLPAIASLLSLNYPIVFLEYGSNFAWSIGLVDIPSLQKSITETRNKTGGHDTAIFGTTLIAQTATRLDPLLSDTGTDNTAKSSTSSTASSSLLGLRRSVKSLIQPISSYANVHSPTLQARQQYAPNTGAGGSLLTNNDNIALPIVTSNPSNNGGIGTFAERLYIAPGNVFLTVLVSMMILLAILIAALILVFIIALIARMATKSSSRSTGVNHQLSHWSHRVTRPSYFLGTVTLATMGRYLMITFPIFFIFAFYQWDYGDSWVSHFLAAIFTIVFLALAFVFFFPMIRHAKKGGKGSGQDDLYYNDDTPPAHAPKLARTWGQMAHMYRPKFYWFSIIFLIYSIIRAMFISFAQNQGTRQAIGLLVLEVILFLSLCIFRIGRDKKSDFVFILLCFSRMAAWAVCVVFIPSANVTTIPRVIVGFVLLVVTALPIIFLFFLTIYDLFTPFLKRNRRDVVHESGDGDYEKRQQQEENPQHHHTTNNTSEDDHQQTTADAHTASNNSVDIHNNNDHSVEESGHPNHTNATTTATA